PARRRHAARVRPAVPPLHGAAPQGRLAAGDLPAGAGGLRLRRRDPRPAVRLPDRDRGAEPRRRASPPRPPAAGRAGADRGGGRGRGGGARVRLMATNPLRDEFRMHRVPGSCAAVIFGGLGDLATRKLVPALYNLYLRRLLPAGFAMIGIGRTDPGGGDGDRPELRKRCEQFSRTPVPDAGWDGF